MVKALVSAAAVTSVIRAQADRVHDVARRLGCTDPEATDVTSAAVASLLDDLDRRPGTVRDLAGGLFARAWEPALRIRRSPVTALRTSAPPSDAPDGVLQNAAQSLAVQKALGSLPDDQRFALLVRDSYGLDLDQTAVALGLDPPEAARVVALGRLALTAAFDAVAPISLAGHDVAVGDLGQLSDGSAPPGGRFASLRRHVAGCAQCASVLFAQSRAKEMLSAFPVLALPGGDRITLLRDAEQRAAVLLPTAQEVRRRFEEGSSRRPLVSPMLIAGLLLLAILIGVGIGALLSSGGSSNNSESALTVTTSPTPVGSVAPTRVATTPSTTPASVPASTTPANSSPPPTTPATVRPTRGVVVPTTKATRPTPTKTAATPTKAPAVAAITATPETGPYGQLVTVHGTGFPAQAAVSISYVDSSGATLSGPVTTQTSALGAFSTQLPAMWSASVTTPPYYFVATVGTNQAKAVFTQS